MYYIIRRLSSCPCNGCCKKKQLLILGSFYLLNMALEYMRNHVILGAIQMNEAIDIVLLKKLLSDEQVVNEYNPDSIIFSFADVYYQEQNSYITLGWKYRFLKSLGSLEPSIYWGRNVESCMSC